MMLDLHGNVCLLRGGIKEDLANVQSWGRCLFPILARQRCGKWQVWHFLVVKISCFVISIPSNFNTYQLYFETSCRVFLSVGQVTSSMHAFLENEVTKQAKRHMQEWRRDKVGFVFGDLRNGHLTSRPADWQQGNALRKDTYVWHLHWERERKGYPKNQTMQHTPNVDGAKGRGKKSWNCSDVFYGWPP